MSGPLRTISSQARAEALLLKTVSTKIQSRCGPHAIARQSVDGFSISKAMRAMFQRKTTITRYFGLDAADWAILILGLTFTGMLMITLL